VLPILIRLQLFLRDTHLRAGDERGQTSAEYALVLLGAASVALLIAVWAKDTNKIGKLLDAIFESITKLVK
jgi:Flp pilus assembly pilin Flp